MIAKYFPFGNLRPSLPTPTTTLWFGYDVHATPVTSSLKGIGFRKPATAVASRRPGRADGLMVGLDGHASLSAGRAPWRDGQAFLPLRRRPEGKVCRRRRQNDAVRPSVSASDQPLLDGGTQWHRLSAAVKQPACRDVQGGPSSITAALDHDNIGVTLSVTPSTVGVVVRSVTCSVASLRIDASSAATAQALIGEAGRMEHDGVDCQCVRGAVAYVEADRLRAVRGAGCEG